MIVRKESLATFSNSLRAIHSAESPAQIASAKVLIERTAWRDDQKYLIQLLDRHVEARTKMALISTPTAQRSMDDQSGMEQFLRLRSALLTRRECEVVYWISCGKSDAEMAKIFQRSIKTIRKHVENILGKLRCKTRLAAVYTAGQWLKNNR